MDGGGSCPDNADDLAGVTNMIKNSTFADGLTNWSPLGACQLAVAGGQPRYIVATNRTETWMGPSQSISAGDLRPGTPYLVSASVRLGSSAASTPATVSISINVDGNWLPGGVCDAAADRWVTIVGAFRVAAPPKSPAVVFSVQGPPPGADLMVTKPQMYAVNRRSRFRQLKAKADKVRKRDIVLRFESGGVADTGVAGAVVKVRQTASGFPLGTAINGATVNSDAFNAFFLPNFSWAVFENELKWYWTEPQQGALNYADADKLLDFCRRNGKRVRGHCIFWDVDNVVQPWLKALDDDDLRAAVDGRLESLLTRYKGQFDHHDVNNEMLHGSFYKDRLGADIRPFMFKRAAELDAGAVLFVNDYNVEAGNDAAATPEKYVALVEDLRQGGAAVGGIGVQGHLSEPVIGEVLCSVFDKLSAVEAPVWITELDVVSQDDNARADDLEVVLREAFAHPAVEGIVLWGFLEGHMWRDNAHLVNADGTVNAAGRRLVALLKEWTSSHADGKVDGNGEFKFRGYVGEYSIEVTVAGAPTAVKQTFAVDKGDAAQVLIINV